MKILFAVLMSSLATGAAHASKIEVRRGAERLHVCEVKEIEVESRYDNQPSQVVLFLTELKGHSHFGCPERVTVPAGSRSEALRLYDMLRGARTSSCLTRNTRTLNQKNVDCDTGFNVRSPVH